MDLPGHGDRESEAAALVPWQVAGLYTAAAPDPEVREAGFVLWNLRASLRVNRLLTIFVRGENLLAERYEINAGYPMPRATVFGGLKLNL